MGWLAPKPSLRDASCGRVEVVKGANGWRRTVLRSTAATVNGSPASSWRTAARAAASSARSNLSSLRPSRWVRRAVKAAPPAVARRASTERSEEHTSELQSLMRLSYAVFCLKKKIDKKDYTPTEQR